MPDPTVPESAGIEPLSDQVVRLTRTMGALKGQLAARHAGGEDGVHGIEWAAYALLFHLVAEGPMRSSALADAVCVDPSTVSRQVAELVRAGLVERVPDPADGRANLLVSTERGRAMHALRRTRRIDMFGRIVAGWPAEDVAALTGLLTRFNDSFSEVRTALLDEMTPAPTTRSDAPLDPRTVETTAS